MAQSSRSVALCSVLAFVLGASVGLAQLDPDASSCYFPSTATDDGRMLQVTGPPYAVVPRLLEATIEVPSGVASFTLSVFDGDTGKADVTSATHWDVGTDQALFSLYFDPDGTGVPDPARLAGQWTGNDPNPTSGTLPGGGTWLASDAEMPDDGWWNLLVPVTGAAIAKNGAPGIYTLIVEPQDPASVLLNNFKLAVDSPSSISFKAFSIEGALRQMADRRKLYPDWNGTLPPPTTTFWMDTRTTNDGTYTLPISVAKSSTELVIFDGDADHGCSGAVGMPSGAALAPCADADDADTPANYAGLPAELSASGANLEGAWGGGSPNDDSAFDIFRRGEPGDPVNAGCFRYELIDPAGTVYRNDNPSGTSEWEQFRVATKLAATPNAADYGPSVAADGTTFVDTPHLPEGVWNLQILGADLGNSFLLRAGGSARFCCLRSGAGDCGSLAAAASPQGSGAKKPGRR